MSFGNAMHCIESNLTEISSKEKKLILLAAHFHDLYNAAFGHSLEYVEQVSPANLFYFAATGKKYDQYEIKHASFEPIFFGMCELKRHKSYMLATNIFVRFCSK